MFQPYEMDNGKQEDMVLAEEDPQMCNNCQIIPEQYISLKCSHNFCLSCISQIYKEISNNSLNPIVCPYDNEETILDEYSISVIQKLIEDSQKQDSINGINEKELLNDSNKKDNVEKSLVLNGQHEQKSTEESPIITKNNINFKEDRIKELKGPFNNTRYFELCSKHLKENAKIYCITCEEGLFCGECLGGTFHAHHEIINLEKHPDFMKKQFEIVGRKIVELKDELTENLRELGSKRKVYNNKLLEAKNQIINDFKDLKEKLFAKEKELLEKMEKYSNEKCLEMEDETLILQEKLKKIERLEEKNHLINHEGQNSMEKLVKSLAICKTEIDEFDINPKKNMEDISDFKCYLNMDSFYKYLESIHILKLEISTFSMKNSTKVPKSSSKSYLNINNNNNNSLEYFSNEHNEIEYKELKRKTMYERLVKFPENHISTQQKKPYLFLKPTYLNAANNNINARVSLASVNKSNNSFVGSEFKDKLKESQRNFSFMKKMKEIGLSRIDEKVVKGGKKVEKLMSSLEKQRSLFEKNKAIF